MKSVEIKSLGQIIADHRREILGNEIATEWAMALLYRPPGLLLAWALQRSSLTPLTVTLMGVACLPAMAAAAVWLSPGPALAVIVCLAIAFMIFDCADGSLARLKQMTGGLGQYSDFAADICYRFVFYGAAGFVLAQHPALQTGWLAAAGFPLALGSAWLMTFARLCRIYAELRFPATAGEARPQPKRMDFVEAFVSGLDGLVPLIAAAAWIFDVPGAFFIWILIYALLDVVNTQLSIISRLARQKA